MILLITIFPRNRRDIFLLYYVKKKESECTHDDRALRKRLAFPIQSIYASRRSMAGGLPLTLLLLCQENTRLRHEDSRCSKIQVTYIFLFSFKSISFPLCLSEFFPFLLFPFDLFRILSRVIADAILIHNIIWWYIYTINDDRLKQHCVYYFMTLHNMTLEIMVTINSDLSLK